MTITYSTNWMGPVSIRWYEARGLVQEVAHSRLYDSTVPDILPEKRGDVVTRKEIAVYYAGGRIDIYGLPHEKYYAGRSEYSLPIMHGKDWNALSDFLDKFTSETQLSYEQLIDMFETNYGKKIRWADA